MSPRVNPAEWYDESTLARRCRSCGARPGDLCRSGSGNVVRPHKNRTTDQVARAKPKTISAGVRLAVVRRSGGWCETCPLLDPHAPRHAGEEVHHIRRRSQGGTDEVSNLMFTCRRGHRIAHDNPKMAEAYGVLVRSTATVQE